MKNSTKDTSEGHRIANRRAILDSASRGQAPNSLMGYAAADLAAGLAALDLPPDGHHPDIIADDTALEVRFSDEMRFRAYPSFRVVRVNTSTRRGPRRADAPRPTTTPAMVVEKWDVCWAGRDVPGERLCGSPETVPAMLHLMLSEALRATIGRWAAKRGDTV